MTSPFHFMMQVESINAKAVENGMERIVTSLSRRMALLLFYNNNFYYPTNPPPYIPILGWWDGANAQVGQNDPTDIPFIHDGGYYLKPSLALTNCINTSSGNGNFMVCTGPGMMQITINAQPVFNTLGQVTGSNPLSFNDISYYKNKIQKKIYN